MKRQIKTLSEIENELKKIWNLPVAKKEEKENWNYKTELSISPRFLIGKQIELDGTKKTVKDVFLNKFGRLEILLENNQKTYLTNSYLVMMCPLTKEELKIQLHPTRAGRNLWSKGFFLKEEAYKKLYYKTEEYRNKYEDTLYKIYGKRIKAPIQDEKIKSKISKTIQKRYGSEWFLNRGKHYEKIENAMLDKYGISNFFNDYEWQCINAEKTRKSGISKSEIDFVQKVASYLNLNESQFYSSNSKLGRKTFRLKKKYYAVDLYLPKEKIVIEFYGDYWHCNPEKYIREYYHSINKMTALEIWERDKKRIQEISKKFNVRFIVVWERDWKKEPEKQMQFIKSEINNK